MISAIERFDSWSRRRRVVGKAEHNQDGANPRFVVTLAGTQPLRGARALRGPLLRPRRGREPASASSSNCLPIGHRPPPCGPISCVTRFSRHGLCSGRQLAPRRPAPYSVRRCRRRDHPAQAAQARRSGPQRSVRRLHCAPRIRLPEQDPDSKWLICICGGPSTPPEPQPWRKPGHSAAPSDGARPPGLVLREAERHRTRNPRTSNHSPAARSNLALVPPKKPPLPTSYGAIKLMEFEKSRLALQIGQSLSERLRHKGIRN